jgi:hypothetical protein
MPSFLWHTFRSKRQVERAQGFLGGRLLVDAHRTYWTLTLWSSEQAMKKFRGAEAHAKVMPRLAHWCDEASYAHWMPVGDSVPSWDEAYEHLFADGRLSRVTKPSEDHANRRFPRPRLNPLIGQELKASKSSAQ